MDDVHAPAYYILSRSIDDARIPAVVDALSMTPPAAVIITHITEGRLAARFSRDILQAPSHFDARAIALRISADMNRPLLVIGEEPGLTAVYRDGTTQEIGC